MFSLDQSRRMAQEAALVLSALGGTGGKAKAQNLKIAKHWGCSHHVGIRPGMAMWEAPRGKQLGVIAPILDKQIQSRE